MAKEKETKEKFEAPGTLVIVLFFFLVFIIFYFRDWLRLSALWPVR